MAGQEASEKDDHRHTKKVHRDSENTPDGQEDNLDHNSEDETLALPLRGQLGREGTSFTTGGLLNSFLSLRRGCCKCCYYDESEYSASAPPSFARFLSPQTEMCERFLAYPMFG